MDVGIQLVLKEVKKIIYKFQNKTLRIIICRNKICRGTNSKTCKISFNDKLKIQEMNWLINFKN